jgi:hypothetical protein
MSEQSISGVYDHLAQAEEAVRRLDRGGFPIKQISIVGQNTEHERDVQGYITVEDLAKKGTGTGALAGGLLGLLTVAASIWIPGFGRLLVAGPLATALLELLGGIGGTVTGAAWGGVFGTLAGWGVSTQHILKYEEHLKAGKYLVIAHGSPAEMERAHRIMHGTGAQDLHHHRDTEV